MLHPDFKAAMAVIPDSSKMVKLRGFDVEHFPIEVRDFVVLCLTDPQTAIAAFGADLETGKAATADQIGKARETLSDQVAAKLIALSTRDPEMEALVPNMTSAEKSRSLAAAFQVTTGGDVTGFFGDVRNQLDMLLALATSQQSKPTKPGVKVRPSGTVTRSSSSSKSSKGSRKK
ncbi:hypothetical protein [Pelagibacterium sp.]|uniref:hypothetical protein n=1 Tax=Pelagibacterium sp. TaxID=1967288 RepID=UPI003A935BEB